MDSNSLNRVTRLGKKYFFDYIFWLEAKFFLEKANLYNAQNLKFLAIPRFGHIKSGPNTRKHCQKSNCLVTLSWNRIIDTVCEGSKLTDSIGLIHRISDFGFLSHLGAISWPWTRPRFPRRLCFEPMTCFAASTPAPLSRKIRYQQWPCICLVENETGPYQYSLGLT